MRKATPAMIALAGLAALAPAALADGCEVWKERELRCSWEFHPFPGGATKSSLRAKLALANKTGADVAATINHWKSICGVAGTQRPETKASVPAGGTHEYEVVDNAIWGPGAMWIGKTCTEVFISCGASKCADVLSIEMR